VRSSVASGPRDAEVEHAHAAVARDHDVVGLDVAVQHADRVRRREHVGARRCDARGLHHRQRSVAELLAQRRAVDELEHEVGPVAGDLAGEHLDDAVVADVRGEPRLAREAFAHRRRLVERHRRQQLERHFGAEFVVACEVDLAHAAGRDEPQRHERPESGRHARAGAVRAGGGQFAVRRERDRAGAGGAADLHAGGRGGGQ